MQIWSHSQKFPANQFFSIIIAQIAFGRYFSWADTHTHASFNLSKLFLFLFHHSFHFTPFTAHTIEFIVQIWENSLHYDKKLCSKSFKNWFMSVKNDKIILCLKGFVMIFFLYNAANKLFQLFYDTNFNLRTWSNFFFSISLLITFWIRAF